ncbi:MAG: transposase [Candidatus Adiutrix intracellularis]|nr:transposase [Candidatus Adiutrix intracellularis]
MGIIAVEYYSDYIHMSVGILLKYSVSEVMGYLKSKTHSR